jgi:hypothetical protein
MIIIRLSSEEVKHNGHILPQSLVNNSQVSGVIIFPVKYEQN